MSELKECPVCFNHMEHHDGGKDTAFPAPDTWWCGQCGTIVPDAAWNRRAEPMPERDAAPNQEERK